MSISATGKERTQEHCNNLSNSHLGQIPWNKGKKCPGRVLNNDHKIAISNSLTGKSKTVEHIKNSVVARKEIGSTMSDYVWYNNGKIHKRSKDGAPEGFVPGRIFKKRSRKEESDAD